MKVVKSLLVGVGLALLTPTLWAQKGDDPYLDDAYLSKKELEVREAKAKVKASARAKALLEAQMAQEKAYEELRAKALAEYKQKIRDQEIDAYNGRLSGEDSLELAQVYDEEYAKASRAYKKRQGEIGSVRIYGPYSSRLSRFYGDDTFVVHNPESVYITEGASLGDTNVYINYGMGWGNSYLPWYDSYYSLGYPYYGGYYGYYTSWRYPYWGAYYGIGGYWGNYYGYYDPWYSPYRYSYWDGYYPYYGGGYWGGYYDGYYSRSYRNGIHRDGVRSSSYAGHIYRPSSYGGYTSGYGAVESARARIHQGVDASTSGGSYHSGWSNSGSAYRGRTGSTYSTGAGRTYDRGSSYTTSPRARSYEYSSPSSSYDSRGGGSSSSRSSSSSSGRGFRGRR